MEINRSIISLLSKYPVNSNAKRAFRSKPHGGSRPIAVPNKPLNNWLKKMNKELSRRMPVWPPFIHGGIKRRSHITYAKPHVGKKTVITIDIRECFDSIREKDIAETIERKIKLDQAQSANLASKLCFNGRIAQGYSTSNFLCNLHLVDTFIALEKALRKKNVSFTNYVDDIALSGNIGEPGDIINTVALALSRSKLRVNKAKIMVMRSSTSQKICGLLVNRRLSLSRQLKLSLFRQVARKTISEESLKGWLANLNNVDIKFKEKLESYAKRKGYFVKQEAFRSQNNALRETTYATRYKKI
jgi:hypothetical protein